MFKDKDEELKRLSRLLQEEEPDEAPEEDEEEFEEEVPEEAPVIYHNFANQYGRARIYNTDTSDTDLDEYSDQVYEPKKKTSMLVLIAIALALAAGIMGVLAFWAARYL